MLVGALVPLVTVRVNVHVYAKHFLTYDNSSATAQCRAGRLGKEWMEMAMFIKWGVKMVLVSVVLLNLPEFLHCMRR